MATRQHGRVLRAIAEGRALSCYLRDAGLSMERPTSDASAFCDGVATFESGIPTGRLTLQGWWSEDIGGPYDTILPRAAQGLPGRVAVLSGGYDVGRVSFAVQGPFANTNQPASLTEVQGFQTDIQASGDIYRFVNLINFDTMPFTNAVLTRDVDRAVSFSSRWTASSINAMLYLHFYNSSATAKTVQFRTAATTGTLGAASILATSGSVAAGATYVNTFGTFGIPLAILNAVRVEITPAPAGGEVVNVVAGMVDLNTSQIAR